MPQFLAAIPAALAAVGPAVEGAAVGTAEAAPGIGAAGAELAGPTLPATTGLLGSGGSFGASGILPAALGLNSGLPAGISMEGPETPLSGAESSMMLGQHPFTATGGTDFGAQGATPGGGVGGALKTASGIANEINPITSLLGGIGKTLGGNKTPAPAAPSLDIPNQAAPSVYQSSQSPGLMQLLRALQLQG